MSKAPKRKPPQKVSNKKSQKKPSKSAKNLTAVSKNAKKQVKNAKKSSKKVKKVIIFIFSLIFLLAAGGGGWLAYKTISSENNATPAATIENELISIHFLELGNKYTGDCIFIQTDEADILIDCGSKVSSISTVAEYLNTFVTDGTLEYVIVTHAHEDHIAGFSTSDYSASIFGLFECQTIIDFSMTNSSSNIYSRYLSNLNQAIENGATHFSALECINGQNGAQSTFTIGNGVTMTILDSYFYSNNSSSENNYSVCTLFTAGEQNFLFTGDLEEAGEEYLVELNSLPEVELFKAGHHGSKTSSSEALLSVIKPKVVCVCCCAGSSEYSTTAANQFPTQDMIDRIAKYTQNVYVTTLCVDYSAGTFTSFNGNIVFSANGTEFAVNCSNNNTILKDTEWFKQNRTCPDEWSESE